MSQFVAQPLTLCRIDQAYPVVQLGLPGLSLPAWRAYAVRCLTGSDSGIDAVLGPHDILHGLAGYAITAHPLHGRVLTADPLIALTVLRDNAVRRTLIAALEQHARARGCGMLNCVARNAPDWLIDGFVATEQLYHKRLGSSAPVPLGA